MERDAGGHVEMNLQRLATLVGKITNFFSTDVNAGWQNWDKVTLKIKKSDG